MTLSIPALAMYLQDGCKSKHMIDYLWPLSDLMRQGSYYDCIGPIWFSNFDYFLYFINFVNDLNFVFLNNSQ